MKLYIAVNDKWHISINGRSSCAGVMLSDLSAFTFDNKNEYLERIPLYLENICPSCYWKHKSYVNQKIIEFKLGIKQ